MPSTREIRRRIRSIKSTSQITKAMEMVSAVKMRRAQAATLASRPYAQRLDLLLPLLAAHQPAEGGHPLLQRRPVRRTALLLITTDRGLCGPLNANTIRVAASFLREQSAEQSGGPAAGQAAGPARAAEPSPGPVSVIAIGRRGRDWMVRHGVHVLADFSGIGDRPSILDTAPIARLIIDGFVGGQFDAVRLVYNRFVSTTVQRVADPPPLLLPIQPAEHVEHRFAEYIFEPDAPTVLSHLLPRFVEVALYQAVLEALASEHSARMVAMHNATENAREVIQELTLSYNKARQSGITKELLEIAAGTEALQRG